MRRRTADEQYCKVATVVDSKTANWVDKERHKANVRLAIILGLVALCFYLVMIFLNPV